jgi:signal transduction histidine kinase
VTLTVQTSNFVHAKGCLPPDFTIGSFENVERQSANDTAAAFVLTGCLLTSFLYHLGLFLLNRSRKNVLIFAVCCLLLALLSKKWFFVFFPDYNWFFAIRFEYILHFATFAMLTLFLERLYPKLLHRFVTRAYYALAGLYTLTTLLLDTTVFTGLLLYFEIASIGMILYILTRLAMALCEKTIQNALSFIGILVVGLFGLNDILYYRGVAWTLRIGGHYFMTPIGMAFFVFCFALVLSIEYAETERREEELTRKTDFYRRMAHDLLTPLTKVSTNIQIAGLQDETDHERLEKSQEEIMRIAAMINDALSGGGESGVSVE